MRLVLGRKGVTNYPYAVARVAAKRAKLVPAEDYEKILKMDVPEVTRFVGDSVYKSEVDELASKFSGLDLLEAALTVNEERTYEQVRQMVGGAGGAIVNLFLDRYHYEDLKTLLRGKNAGASREELLREMVLENEDTYALFNPLLSDDVKGVADVIAALESRGRETRAWAQILRSVPAGSPLARYEDALDAAFYARLLAGLDLLNEKGVDQVRDFVRREIDTRNLLNAARWVAAGETGDFASFVIPGGRFLNTADVVQLAKAKSLEALGDQLADTRFPPAVKEGLEAVKGTGRLGAFQAAVWRSHFEAMDKMAHGAPLSLLPILLFLLKKRREVVTIRAVARGKAAGLSEVRLRELIA